VAAITDEELRERTRALLAEVHPDQVDRVRFRGAQFDHGLAWVHFPEGLGGLGLAPGAQRVVQEELRRAARTTYHDLAVNPIGIGMGAPTILAYGTEEMKRRYLRPIFTGEEIWCQLFSEPGAGSDVAGLATRAVRDGDAWVVTGQKIWTSLAHVSRWGLLLARTDPDLPKHDGLSYFILDMQAPGVEVRPLYQITGEAEFNEVFLNGVRIPHAMMLGEPGQGWAVAITTLMNERVALGGGAGAARRGPIDVLLDVWKRRSKPVDERGRAREAVQRDRVTQLWIQARLLELTSQRARAAMRAGTPGPEGSVGKLMMAEVNQRIYEACLDLLGEDGLVYEPGYELRRPAPGGRDWAEAVKHTFLRSRAFSIEGGTSEIMRNILGERVLGLAGDLRADKGRPWSEVPRS
jgi:alkylation response protein AidB-like acyl-CoA dehydrogenase